jgi:uncharacterized damage-inducible protein DinB
MSLNQVANAMRQQLDQYAENVIVCLSELTEEQIWTPGPQGSNSIGTLTHHLSGNLRHFLGAGLLKDGYKRDRDGEFADRNISTGSLTAEMREALKVAAAALETIDTQLINAPHQSVDGREFPSLAHMLLMITAHFSYHTGQINYLKRLLLERS